MGSKITLRILVDNREHDGLSVEHGFAVLLETEKGTILFDTGQSGALQANAQTLGYDLSAVNKLALSHGHFDHTGTITEVLAINPTIEVYAHPQVFTERYSLHPDKAPRSIGMPAEQQQALNALPANQLHVMASSQELLPGIELTGEIPRLHPLEDTGGPFFFDLDGQQTDTIADDQSIWFKTPNGLVILTGCCHSGLINTVEQIQKVSCETKIYAIMGGLHLLHASEQRLQASVDALRAWQPELIIPCHCSGDDATAFLQAQLGDVVTPGYVGLALALDLA